MGVRGQNSCVGMLFQPEDQDRSSRIETNTDEGNEIKQQNDEICQMTKSRAARSETNDSEV